MCLQQLRRICATDVRRHTPCSGQPHIEPPDRRQQPHPSYYIIVQIIDYSKSFGHMRTHLLTRQPPEHYGPRHTARYPRFAAGAPLFAEPVPSVCRLTRPLERGGGRLEIEGLGPQSEVGGRDRYRGVPQQHSRRAPIPSGIDCHIRTAGPRSTATGTSSRRPKIGSHLLQHRKWPDSPTWSEPAGRRNTGRAANRQMHHVVTWIILASVA